MEYPLNLKEEYDIAITRSHIINAILALNPVFKREYLVTLTTDELEDLEESLILTRHSS
jgi:hypothetical protein